PQLGFGLHPVTAVGPQAGEIRRDQQAARRTVEARQPGSGGPVLGQVFRQVRVGGRHQARVQARLRQLPAQGGKALGGRRQGMRQGHGDFLQAKADTSSLAAVLARISSTVTPGASSVRRRPSSVTSITPRSVMIRFTTPTPVSGSVHAGSSFRDSVPSLALATCSMSTTTLPTPATRSMAPPMPLIILPGIIQLARSPFSDTCMAPRMARLILPPRIMANESAEAKIEEPGSVVTVCLPALIRSASTSS